MGRPASRFVLRPLLKLDYLALALDRVCKQIGLGSVYNDDSHQWASVIASYVIAMAILSAGDA